MIANNVAVLSILIFLWMQQAALAENITVRFKENPVCESSVVRLADLVSVSGDLSGLDRILSAPLSPAPAVGATQVWHSRDILQHMQLRGVPSRIIAWDGQTRAQVQRKQESLINVDHRMSPAFVDDRLLKVAQSHVSRALADFITLQTGERVAWDIDVTIDQQFTRALQNKRNILAIGGGSKDIVGPQEFLLDIKGTDGTPRRVKVAAVVRTPEMVVVASRPLRRDEVLTEEALKMKVLPRGKLAGQNYFTDYAALLGQQMRRGLSTGLPITDAIIGPPVVITRSQLVTIECSSGAIVVKTSGKALASGAVGDLIEVEMPGRIRATGSVVDSMTVRVAASGSHVYR